MVEMLTAIYPERTWYPWLFGRVPTGYWDDINNERRFFDWIAQKLGILQHQDWAKVTMKHLKDIGAFHYVSHKYGENLFKGMARYIMSSNVISVK
jgi:hypothetical protein